ncbi:active regulator of SIRT1 isoform X2 [Esox lucius]|uniref:active regulator of SIRT1 isoform X2 n=1 Tax=Esox lucius TaxID=8010 RepID=UPI00147717A2|nr:active regulator of SIRT1 isoform X2 [Esox lucius]
MFSHGRARTRCTVHAYKKQKGAARKKNTPKKAEMMNLVSTNRQGVSRGVRRLQGRLGPGKSKATVKGKRVKSAVEEFRKTQGKSHLTSNLQYFLRTGFSAAESETAKIVSQNSGRQSRHRPDRTVPKPPEEKSVFTEEEFLQFQKEYFGRTVEQGN